MLPGHPTITVGDASRPWAISALSISNDSFGLNFLSIPLVQGQLMRHLDAEFTRFWSLLPHFRFTTESVRAR